MKYLFFYFLFPSLLIGQTFKATLNISTFDKTIDVTIEGISSENTIKKLYFTDKIPNYNQKVFPIDFMHDFTFKFSNFKNPMKIDFLQKGFYEFKESKLPEKISYTVKENFGYNTFAPTSNYINEDLIMLNLSYILGYFDKKDSTFYDINYTLNSAEDTIKLGTKSFLNWEQSPIILKAKNTFHLSEFFPLTAYSNTLNIGKDEFLDLLGKTIYATDFFHKEGDKELIFIFDTLDTAPAAITHKKKAILYFHKKNLLDKNFKIRFQSLLIQAMLDWWIPLKEPKADPSKRWFVEGAKSYLSYKYMLKNQLINSNEFLNIFSKKMSEAEKFEEISLENISIKAPEIRDYEKAIYNKGLIYCWYFDYLILKNSPFSIEEILLGKFDFKTEETGLKLNDALSRFENENVILNKPIDKENLFRYWGLENDTTSKRVHNISFKENLSKEQKENWKRYAN